MYRIPEMLKAKRLELNMSQPKMASHVGVHERTYQAWERDKCVPKEENCEALSNVLGVPIYELEKQIEKEKFSRRKAYDTKNH